MNNGQLLNFVDGQWVRSSASDYLDVMNPATAQALTTVPLSPGAEVETAVSKASAAFYEWRRTPSGERIQPLFRLKTLLEESRDELARIITNECGKTYGESLGEIQRGSENVEVA